MGRDAAVREKKVHISRQHMVIHWHSLVEGHEGTPLTEDSLEDKASLIGRVGLMMLSVGTSAWRVRSSMNHIAQRLDVTLSADIGLLSINYTCFSGEHTVSGDLTLYTSGINTDRLWALETFMKHFDSVADQYSAEQFHKILDDIQNRPGNYRPLTVGAASALACCGFTFLLGGGPIEMLCAFIGAGVGNFVKRLMHDRNLSLFACVAVGVASACASYVGAIKLFELFTHVSANHEAGYICSMLFVIPGFPLITGGIDLAKLDMRSGIERLTYAFLIILIATLTGWVSAYILQFEPADFAAFEIPHTLRLSLRVLCSFAGVYGFSLMYNSPRKMAAAAGLVGMISNTLRLELVEHTAIPFALAAYIGALSAGLMTSVFRKKIGYPRISLTVPSIVIMVPGLYMYRGIYQLGFTEVGDGSVWLVKAAAIILSLPLGLVTARYLTDSDFRHCS